MSITYSPPPLPFTNIPFALQQYSVPLHMSSVTSVSVCCAWLSRLMRLALLFDRLLENISRERSTDGPIWRRWQLTGDPPLRFLNTETTPVSHLHNQTNCVEHALSRDLLIHRDCTSQTSQLSASHADDDDDDDADVALFLWYSKPALGTSENRSARLVSFNYEPITLFSFLMFELKQRGSVISYSF